MTTPKDSTAPFFAECISGEWIVTTLDDSGIDTRTFAQCGRGERAESDARAIAAAMCASVAPLPAPSAYERRWSYDGVKPQKSRQPNGRMGWDTKFKFIPVTKIQCLPDDVPLFSIAPGIAK